MIRSPHAIHFTFSELQSAALEPEIKGDGKRVGGGGGGKGKNFCPCWLGKGCMVEALDEILLKDKSWGGGEGGHLHCHSDQHKFMLYKRKSCPSVSWSTLE
jgi:hypothetical protein